MDGRLCSYFSVCSVRFWIFFHLKCIILWLCEEKRLNIYIIRNADFCFRMWNYNILTHKYANRGSRMLLFLPCSNQIVDFASSGFLFSVQKMKRILSDANVPETDLQVVFFETFRSERWRKNNKNKIINWIRH